MTTQSGRPVQPIPARSLAVIAYPPDVPDAPQLTPKPSQVPGSGSFIHEGGWFPQCKPGLEVPWDNRTWGKAPSVLPDNFYPFPPVMFGKAYPLCKNELFPIIKTTRALLGRNFYGFLMFYNVEISAGKINYTQVSSNEACDQYTLLGDFSDGFEGYPVIDIDGTPI